MPVTYRLLGSHQLRINMSNPAPQLVHKLWNYCNPASRDNDGLSFHLRRGFGGQGGDYVEQLTFLLFLKMADEQSRPPFNPPSHGGFGVAGKPSAVPKDYAWPSLLASSGRLATARASG